MTKKYEVGMYGGKFLPMHKGHVHCLETALDMCEKVYLIMFAGGMGEQLIRKSDHRDILSVESRTRQLMRAASGHENIIPLVIDVSECRTPEGNEDWDAETPLVLDACGHFDAVFGSEPTAYAPYFARAYPWADYVVVDAKREAVPISATMVRAMDEEEAKKWIV